MLACPNCEYENNSKGRPVVSGDVATCLACGNSWKEYSEDTVNLVNEKRREPAILHPVSHLPVFENPAPETRMPAPAPTHNSGNWTAYLVAVLIVLLGTVAYFGVEKPDQGNTELVVADVKLQTNNRTNGTQVITVSGKISNQTPLRKNMPPVTIILRDNRGSEISRWRHKSLKVALNPGSATRFSSSIQHASKSIASADIVLN